MRRLIRYKQYFGSMGDLGGMFLVNDVEWGLLQRLIQDETEVCYGEVLGKHSYVAASLKPECIEIVTDDQAWLDEADELGIDLATGISPLAYYADQGL